MKTNDIAQRLVALCRAGKFEEAQKELFADNVVSIESRPSPAFERETKGLAAIIEKGHKFQSMIEKLFELTVSDPLVAGDSIACTMSMDVKMKGQDRMKMSEVCVYEVKDEKIISEQFHM